MDGNGWKAVIERANNDSELRETFIQYLMECEKAKQLLVDNNYSWMGLSLYRSIELLLMSVRK
jgi:hypothetical protein